MRWCSGGAETGVGRGKKGVSSVSQLPGGPPVQPTVSPSLQRRADRLTQRGSLQAGFWSERTWLRRAEDEEGTGPSSEGRGRRMVTSVWLPVHGLG